MFPGNKMRKNIEKVIFCVLIFCLGELTSCVNTAESSEICFIGDSITFLWDLEYYFPDKNIVKHGVSGTRIENIEKWNIDDCIGKKTVVLIGTNNVASNADEKPLEDSFYNYFFKYYGGLVHRLKATPFIAVSVLPRNEDGRQPTLVNEQIEILNNRIRRFLDTAGVDYKYINAFPYFLREGYSINNDLFSDGLHPSQEGYELLSRIVGGEI